MWLDLSAEINQSAKGTEMTDSMKTWPKSEFL